MELPITKELDFTEHWIDSIGKEVLRGIKVRDEKIKIHQSDSFYQYDFLDFDYTEPSCSKSYGPSELKRPLSSKNNGYSHGSVSPHKMNKRCKNIKKYKRIERNTCGMRIAELAVPSKRHCIETWRSQWDNLPTLMVDRLRQIVMDEKPIIPIQDAIICFKRKQPSNSRSSHKGNKTVKSKRYEEVKLLCAIFGFRIAAQLAQPRNITLGSRLIPISHVVNEEIKHLLGKHKKGNFQKSIQLEIANKITNWIADILEQSTFNLMLEDYNELEKQEGHIWDIIDELVDNVVLLCKEPSISSSSDVIEAESDSNPSFVNEESDDLKSVDFENIMSDIIEKITSINDLQAQDTDVVSGDNLSDVKEYNSNTSFESTKTYFKNLLYNHMDEVEKTFNDEEFEDAVHFNDSDMELLNRSIPNDKLQHTIPNAMEESKDDEIVEINNDNNINNNFNEYIDNIEDAFNNDFLKAEAAEQSNGMENNRNSIDLLKHIFNPQEVSVSLSDEDDITDVIKPSYQEKDMVEIIKDNETENIGNIIEEKNFEIDETIPLKDVTSDDSLKKVKFSNMDSEQGQLKSKSDFRVGDNKKSGPLSIHFAPPNEYLLSDADESWPDNLRFPIVKATVSISKSVLSLGKLNECDENNTEPGSVNEDRPKSNYIDGEIVEDSIENKMAFLKTNRSNEQVIVEKPTNKDPRSGVKDAVRTNNIDIYTGEVPKIVNKYIILVNKNSNEEHLVDKNLTTISHSDIEDVTEKINEKLDWKRLQTIFNDNSKRNTKHDVTNITNNEPPSVIEDIKKTNEENVQEIIGKESLKIKRSKEHMINKNLTNRSISQVSQGVGSETEWKNKAIETSNIINKKRSVILSMERLPVIFICPDAYKQNILILEKALQKDETSQLRPDENCQHKECEVRIWCQGLQNVIQNLDLWLDWVDNSCSNLAYLKQREKFPSCNKKIQKYNNHKLIKLKTNIDADAKLWTNLSTSLQLGLRSYKYFPKQLEPRRPFILTSIVLELASSVLSQEYWRDWLEIQIAGWLFYLSMFRHDVRLIDVLLIFKTAKPFSRTFYRYILFGPTK